MEEMKTLSDIETGCIKLRFINSELSFMSSITALCLSWGLVGFRHPLWQAHSGRITKLSHCTFRFILVNMLHHIQTPGIKSSLNSVFEEEEIK